MSPRRAARALLLAALAGCALFLLLAAPPWQLPGGPGFFAHEGDALHHVVLRALWWGTALAAGLCAALFATAGIWTAPVAPREPPPPRVPRWLVPLLLAALLLGAGVRWQLVRGGLWWDEAWLVRRIAVGEFRPEPGPGGQSPRFVAVPWIRTLFEYEKPTNHQPQSAASRLANDLWRAASGAAPHEFDEFALRFPPFAAALATIVLLGLLVAEWGFPRAGAAAAFLLALQPWHIEIATGARGFAFVGLGAVLGALALCRALRSGAWGWWLLYAASQVLLLWTHPFAIYLTACLGAAALARLALGARWHEAARLVAAHALVAAALLVVLGPAIAQVPLWHDAHVAPPGDKRSPLRLAGKMGHELWLERLARPLAQRAPDRSGARVSEPRGAPRAAAGARARDLPRLPGAGGRRARRGAPPARTPARGRRWASRARPSWRSAPPPPSGTSASASTRATCSSSSPWCRRSPRSGSRPARRGSAARAAAGCSRRSPSRRACCCSPGWTARPSPTSRRTPTRACARPSPSSRPSPTPARRSVSASASAATRRASTTRTLLHVESGEELRALCARAQAEGRPLYVLLGYTGQNRKHRRRRPSCSSTTRSLFEPLGRFEAVAPEFVYRVLRYRPGGR